MLPPGVSPVEPATLIHLGHGKGSSSRRSTTFEIKTYISVDEACDRDGEAGGKGTIMCRHEAENNTQSSVYILRQFFASEPPQTLQHYKLFIYRIPQRTMLGFSRSPAITNMIFPLHQTQPLDCLSRICQQTLQELATSSSVQTSRFFSLPVVAVVHQ